MFCADETYSQADANRHSFAFCLAQTILGLLNKQVCVLFPKGLLSTFLSPLEHHPFAIHWSPSPFLPSALGLGTAGADLFDLLATVSLSRCSDLIGIHSSRTTKLLTRFLSKDVSNWLWKTCPRLCSSGCTTVVIKVLPSTTFLTSFGCFSS